MSGVSGNIFSSFSVMRCRRRKDEVCSAVATVALSILVNTCGGTLRSASERLDDPGVTQLAYSTSSCVSVTHRCIQYSLWMHMGCRGWGKVRAARISWALTGLRRGVHRTARSVPKPDMVSRGTCKCFRPPFLNKHFQRNISYSSGAWSLVCICDSVDINSISILN